MKISIITVCLNSEKTIENTIRSVIKQNYDQIEYIVIIDIFIYHLCIINFQLPAYPYSSKP